METLKYPRTYHFPFSPGTTSDDRIKHDWQGILANELVITEKLDGENTCIKFDGVYARSHACFPTQSRNKQRHDSFLLLKRHLFFAHFE